MHYRNLGRSGAVVSELALGTMTFGRETDEAGSHEQLDRFVEAGGTLVDTADVYAETESESIIGRWLAKRPADVTDQIVIATKGRFPTGTGPNDLGTSRRHLHRALDGSLRRLGVEHIDLYQMHAWDPLTPIEETLRFLDDAVRAGKIGYPGLSNFTGWQLQRFVDLAERLGVPQPVTLQPQYNLLVREIEWEIVPAAQANGLGLLPWSPLGGGWLTGKYTRDERPSGATRLGENPERGVSMAQVALAWVRQQPAVTSVILGARTLEQLQDNLAAADLALQEGELEVLAEASDPGAADYPYGVPGVHQRGRTVDPKEWRDSAP